MSPQAFLDKYQNQSLLYNTAHPELKGQCVQATCFYVSSNNLPVIWADAYQWWANNQYAGAYQRIANTTSAVPQVGDIIIWGPSLPNSGGAGHIAVCLKPLPGTGTFISVDQNWGGKYVHAVTHNYDFVVGWLRPYKTNVVVAPVITANDLTPAERAQVVTIAQGDEMIANRDQAIAFYKLLRFNQPSEDEINSKAGKETWVQATNNAMTEITERNQAWADQKNELNTLYGKLNELNQTVTSIRSQDDADKAALAKALNQVASLSAELQTAQDRVRDAQKALDVKGAQLVSTEKAGDSGAVVRLLAWLLRKKA